MCCQTSQVFTEYLISNYFLFHRLPQVFYRPTCTRLGIHEMVPLQLSMASMTMNEGRTTSSVLTLSGCFRSEILCAVHRGI